MCFRILLHIARSHPLAAFPFIVMQTSYFLYVYFPPATVHYFKDLHSEKAVSFMKAQQISQLESVNCKRRVLGV